MKLGREDKIMFWWRGRDCEDALVRKDPLVITWWHWGRRVSAVWELRTWAVETRDTCQEESDVPRSEWVSSHVIFPLYISIWRHKSATFSFPFLLLPSLCLALPQYRTVFNGEFWKVESCERCQEQSVEGIKKVFTFILFFHSYSFLLFNGMKESIRRREEKREEREERETGWKVIRVKNPLLISLLSLQQFFCVKKSKDMLVTVKKRKAENCIKLQRTTEKGWRGAKRKEETEIRIVMISSKVQIRSERLNTRMLSSCCLLSDFSLHRENTERRREVRSFLYWSPPHNSATSLFLPPLVSPCLLSGSELHIRAFVSLEKTSSSESSRGISRVVTIEMTNRCSRQEGSTVSGQSITGKVVAYWQVSFPSHVLFQPYSHRQLLTQWWTSADIFR